MKRQSAQNNIGHYDEKAEDICKVLFSPLPCLKLFDINTQEAACVCYRKMKPAVFVMMLI